MPGTTATRSEWLIAKSEAVATRGMVTADQPAAADAALDVLRDGGNAVDAAVTAAFAMGVAEPSTSGVGGVACMVVRSADGRETVIDGSSTAPLGATSDMFRIASGSQRAGMYGWPATVGNESNIGYRSLGVPGMVAAMALALDRYGTIPLSRAIAPAIALARDGIEVDHYLALQLASYADRLWPIEESTRVFYKEGRLPPRPAMGLEPADRLVQPDLARSLEAIAAGGPDALYRGELARAIVDDVRAHGGLITLDEMAAYRAREREPLVTDYRGHRVATVPGCSGGITLVELLDVLEGFPLGTLDRRSARYVHLLAESERRAFADRLALLGDPDVVDAPFARLASKEHAAAVRSSIDAERATVDLLPLAAAADDVAHTTHVSVVDERRMCVSLTSTLGGGFGSGVVARGTGIVLANVMTWFDPRPGRPNSIAPGKRILWAPAPSVVSRDGAPRLVVGAPGGRKLITAVLQSILNVLDHGDAPQEAVNGLRVHCEGPETWVDARMPAETRAQLAAMGHTVVVKEETLSSTWFGRPNAILIDGATLRGGVNRLKPSTAAGY